MRLQESIEYEGEEDEGFRKRGEKENENERKRKIVRRYPILARPPAPTTPLPIFFQGVSHASSI